MELIKELTVEVGIYSQGIWFQGWVTNLKTLPWYSKCGITVTRGTKCHVGQNAMPWQGPCFEPTMTTSSIHRDILY